METAINIPKYNLNKEEERKEILRHYRGLLRVVKSKMKPGDKELLRTPNPISSTHILATARG